ncbi:MAG TPA: FAD-dependent monooxygenase [Micromonosporaceae bacterium]|jgi:2-polyprenyl-6-methoxyphenol hydroxylase-like FAD-dependent oxidoreductase
MRSAVVVGAGIGGLAAAGVLARSGWQVTLLERADRVRADHTALFLWPNGVRALGALGLGEGLDAIATPVPNGGIRRPDGRWLVQPTGAGDGPVVVHREDLHDALVAGLGDRVAIRTGVSVRGVHLAAGDRPAVTDGRSEFEADLVVAADGVDSAIRGRLAPQATAVSAGCAAWRAVLPWYRAPRLPLDRPVGGQTLGAGYRFVAASLGERGSSGASSRGGIYWVATAAGAARPEPPDTQLGLLRRWFAGWHAPIGELLAATEPDDLVQQDVRELRPLPRAYAFPAGPGGVVLLGDAAHAMPHHLGQGACVTLEDAATLGSVLHDAIPGDGLRAAIRTYDAVRRPRAARVVRQARRVGAVVQARGRLTLRARDAVLGTRPLTRLLTVRADG